MRHNGKTASAFLAGFLGVVLGALMMWLAMGRGPSASPKGGGAAKPLPAISRGSQDAITAAVASVGPAVVNINTLIQPRISPAERAIRGVLGMPTEPFPSPGQGSGIIIDGERGYVLTNAHMVQNVVGLQVRLADGREFQARVVGDRACELGARSGVGHRGGADPRGRPAGRHSGQRFLGAQRRLGDRDREPVRI